jgi:hypothetical protein
MFAPPRPIRSIAGRTTIAVVILGTLAGCQLVAGQGHAETEMTDVSMSPAPVDQGAPVAGRHTVTYVDVTGADRRVEIEVRRPAGTGTDTLPVVVWSHGGSQGKRTATVVGEAWGVAAGEAGAAFVAVAHPGRSTAERSALCDEVGAGVCQEFSYLFWDRPHDIAAVLDWIETDGVGLDASRIVYGGHSAGAIGVMTVAGMAWPFDSELAPPSDPRPIAFVAASPPGRETRGLTARSFVDLDRPVLFLTGAGDTTGSTEADDRHATFGLLPTSPTSFMLWVDDERARHSVFNLEPSACERAGGTRSQCRSMVRTVGRVGVEFVRMMVTDGDADEYDERVATRLGRAFEWSRS